jgi:Zn-dependent M28 family amino/carboxypeptidase
LLGPLLLCTCTEQVSDEAVTRARTFASDVSQARLMEDVHALVGSHRSDTPIDCSRIELDPSEQPMIPLPYCSLTREAGRDLVRARLEELGLTVTTQDSAGPAFASQNIIAEKKGEERPDEVVIVAAHYDAFHAGADDNSSGVAALLELARLVSSQRFARTVRFVAFDLEELGIIGSSRYVETLRDEELVVAVVFDCIGYTDSRPGSQGRIPGFAMPDVGDFLAAIANEHSRPRLEELLSLQARLQHVPVRGAVAPGAGPSPLAGQLLRSDHAPFWFAGQRALFLTDTANLRNPHYHQDTDTPETLDPAFLAGVTRLTAASLSLWAGGPLP